MKQLLSLALALLPCLAWAQYPSNGNQKITLGEQTTADGLIWRGVLADTGIITPSSDTSAYIILDTVNNRFYNYNRATNVWSVAGGGTAVTSITGGTGLTGGTITTTGTLAADTNFLVTRYDTTSMLTPYIERGDTASMLTNYYRSGRALGTPLSGVLTNATGLPLTTGVTGTLPVANGGTGQNTLTANKVLVGNGTTGIIQATNLHWDNTAGRLGINRDNPLTRFDLQAGALNTVAIFRSTNPSATITFGSNNSTLDEGYPVNGIGATGDDMKIYTNNAARFTIKSDGKTGIGTESPLALLNVMGTVRINSASAPDANYYLQLENSASQKAKANAWDTYSDSRIKTNRLPILNAIDKINLLNPIYYNQHDSYVENDLLNIDYNNSYKSLGFIAQEVYEVIPEAVNIGTTNELWAMDYTKLIPILTKAIQEQQTLIKSLEQRIINLENK